MAHWDNDTTDVALENSTKHQRRLRFLKHDQFLFLEIQPYNFKSALGSTTIMTYQISVILFCLLSCVNVLHSSRRPPKHAVNWIWIVLVFVFFW